MIFLDVLSILARVCLRLCTAGFFVSMFLYKKHKIFENIFAVTGFIMLWYGVIGCIIFVIFGIQI